VHIDGLAASAASFVAMAGDSIEIARGGRMMIHDAQSVGIGGPAEMREYADMLDAISDDIAGYYANRAGGKPAAWRAAMAKETWYSAAEAVDARLADRLTPAKKNSAPDNRTRLIVARHRALTTRGG
jgi:ATP-dependent protease ClpP protease subunit